MYVCMMAVVYQARGVQELFSRREIGDLRMHGVGVEDGLSLTNFRVACIMGQSWECVSARVSGDGDGSVLL